MMRAHLACVLLLLSACSSDDSSADSAGNPGTSGTTSAGGDATTANVGTTAADEGSTAAAGVDTTAADTMTADGSTGGVCADEFPAIVTDIDETLTTADGEFVMQLADGNYDPLERAGGAALINAYADLGYRIFYLTARAQTLITAVTNETAREATLRWLQEHGYPMDKGTTSLMLAPALVFGAAAREYKGQALMDLQAQGWRFDYAYGNATSDIGGYEDAGLDKATTFIIGPEAGVEGTVAVEGEDWLAHTADHLPTVPAVCE